MVGRIGRPHGVRGRVTVEVRTDDPDLRFAPGTVLRTDPPERGPLTVVGRKWHSGTLLLQLADPRERVADPRGRRGAARHPAAGPGRRPARRSRTRTPSTTTSWSGSTARLPDGTVLGEVTARPARGARTCSSSAVPTGGELLVPFVSAIVPTVDLAGGLRRGRPARGAARPVSVPASTSSRSSPSTWRPLGQSLLGKAAERGLVARRRARPARSGPTTCTAPSTTRPTAAARAWSCAPSRGAARWTPSGPPGTRLVVPTPAGRPFTQALAAQWATEPGLVFACGRYEGIDQRVADWAADAGPVVEVSHRRLRAGRRRVRRPGDGRGGHPAAPRRASATPSPCEFDSHADGLLEGPSYTRPASWRGHEVPPVLLSGDHAAIARWRRAESLRRTADAPSRPAGRAARRGAEPPTGPRWTRWLTRRPGPPGRPGAGAGPGAGGVLLFGARLVDLATPPGAGPVLVHARRRGGGRGGAAAGGGPRAGRGDRPGRRPRRARGAGLAAPRRRAAAAACRWTTGRPTSCSGTSSTRSTSAGRPSSRRTRTSRTAGGAPRRSPRRAETFVPARARRAAPGAARAGPGRGRRASSPEDVAQ